MHDRWTDLERPPLREAELRRALLRPGSLWSSLSVLAETGSTNAELVRLAKAGAAEGTVLIAERQTAGRGRLGRTWESPPRAGIAMSVLLRPAEVPVARYGWLPLLAGVALADATGLRSWAAPDGSGLKWPNDLLVEGRKCAGILAEVADGAIVVGIGLNVSLRREELPREDATSLVLEGAPVTDRAPLVKALLRSIESRYTAWRLDGGDPEASGLRAAYKERCVTLGRTVRVMLPGDVELTGTAADVDSDGRLVVTHPGGREAIAAGDVVHVRA
ncbi:biotin--[acetyl-CoA-carboxylase] ligase [Longispora albida]|uniref:biotin--[acetyl-CoA-carboxylase] ligase n=1 Tax=Longispora albida TaxID=203523 RepID=UPI000475F6CE|nr:biotin--[acetyl-CoA-carboxylase] ligase [Longispora albida]